VIPYQLPLLLWIPIGTLIMMQRNSARGVVLNYLLATMILPAGVSINLSMLPAINSTSAATIAAILGTVLFHPQAIISFRLRWFDVLVGVLLCFAVTTSVVNGFGVYDGLSNAFADVLFAFATLFILRMHITTPQRLRSALLVLVWCSVAYLPFVIYEFRMSPQIHRMLYGYFQHVFAQHYRFGFWRPTVCFPHGLVLGRFYALTAFLALMPLRGVLARQVPFGQWLFLAPGLGLLLSVSFGPWLLFVLFCGSYMLFKRRPRVLMVAPAVAFFLLALTFAGQNALHWTVGLAANVSAERAESLKYRLDAIEEYRSNIVSRPVFGWGGWGNGRIAGRATDSAFLIRSLSRGLVGAGILYLYYVLYLRAAVDACRRARGTPIENDLAAIVCIVAWAIALESIDQGMGVGVGECMAAGVALQGYLKANPNAFKKRVSSTRRGTAEPPPPYGRRPVHAARMAYRARSAEGGESAPGAET